MLLLRPGTWLLDCFLLFPSAHCVFDIGGFSLWIEMESCLNHRVLLFSWAPFPCNLVRISMLCSWKDRLTWLILTDETQQPLPRAVIYVCIEEWLEAAAVA